MQLDDVRALLQVIDQGSVQAAARVLRIPRTSLRRRLENLEAEVGVPLLQRVARGVALTPAGRVVAARGRALLDEADTIVAHARASTSEAVGVIRVTHQAGLPTLGRVRALLALQHEHPGLQVRSREIEDPQSCWQEPFDILIHFGPAPERDSWVSRVVLRMPQQLLAAPAYLERHGIPESVDELARHRLMTWRAPGNSGSDWPLCAGGTVPVSPWFASPSLDMLASLAEAGMGIVLIPAPEDLRLLDRSLVRVLPGIVGRPEAIRFTLAHPSEGDPKTRAILDSLFSLLEGDGVSLG